MSTVVILQPQFLPWLGVFEQIARCDTFVHFDDVQLPQGRSFCTRVQIKTGQGIQWLSVPCVRQSGQTILATRTDEATDWRKKHLATLATTFAGYAHRDDALDIATALHAGRDDRLCEINVKAIELIASYLGLSRRFARSSAIATDGAKDDLLLSILRTLDATTYVSGMGGLKYIDHDKFERLGIGVEYMSYACKAYPQPNGAFTPYVTALDAIAACGPRAAELIVGASFGWREAMAEATDDTRTS